VYTTGAHGLSQLIELNNKAKIFAYFSVICHSSLLM
jgi:hypothetical protein